MPDETMPTPPPPAMPPRRGVASVMANVPASFRATILYGLSMIWSRGVGLAMVPVMTAHLAPASFGRLELLSSAAEIAGLMIGAGLVDTLFRFAAAPGDAGRRLAGEVMGLTVAIGLVCLALVLCFADMIAALMPLATPAHDIMLLGVLIVMESVIGVALGWMRMRGRAGGYAVISGLRASMQAVLITVLLWQGLAVTGVLAGNALAAAVVAGVLILRQISETKIVLAPRGLGRLLAYSLPLVGSGLASFVLGSADRWLLAGSVDAASLGHYALAARFALIVAMLMQPFDLWWYARRMALLEQPLGMVRMARVVRLGMAGIWVAGAATSAVSPVLIHLLAPTSYAPAAAMLPWIVLSLCLQMLCSLANIGCYAGRTTTMPLLVNAAAAGVALVLYVTLIPRLGVTGAIAATVSAQAVRLALFTVLGQRRVRVDLPYVSTMVLGALAAGTAAAAQYGEPGLAGLGLSAACVMATALAALLLEGRSLASAALVTGR